MSIPHPHRHPPIIDSHIHLYPSTALPTLAWCPPTHPLHAPHSIEHYLVSTSPTPSSHNPDPSLQGFIFIEADRKTTLHPTSPSQPHSYGWDHALQELAFATYTARNTTHPSPARLLGIVPWAPIPLGADGMATYVSRARASVGNEDWGLVKGFRYLVQDKEAGTMGADGFVEGVRWCGREGMVFELGVDAGVGMWQLEEGVRVLGRVYKGLEGEGEEGKGAVVVIDHMCKPDMGAGDTDAATRDAVFAEWEEHIKRFARYPQMYMKLSGAFSQIPPLPAHDEARPWSVTPELRAAKSRVAPWVSAVFRAFGPERIMFGSDWPVCNLGGGGGKVAWWNWRWVVEEILRDLGLSEEQKRAVWGGTAARAYKIS